MYIHLIFFGVGVNPLDFFDYIIDK
jgi:hypothetical protein